MELNSRYRVIFSGDVVEGHDKGTVKEKLALLFRAEPARIEQMFTGRNVSIKKDVDYSTAQRYCQALQRVGAVCRIMPIELAQQANVHEQPKADLGQTLVWVGELFASGTSGPDGKKPQTS